MEKKDSKIKEIEYRKEAGERRTAAEERRVALRNCSRGQSMSKR